MRPNPSEHRTSPFFPRVRGELHVVPELRRSSVARRASELATDDACHQVDVGLVERNHLALGVSVLDGCDREPVELRALGEDPVEGARHLERVRSRVANGESPFRGSEPGGEVDEIMGLELELAGQSRVALLGAFVMRSDLDVRPIRAGADPLQLVRRRERES
jgi:hypothetical protein